MADPVIQCHIRLAEDDFIMASHHVHGTPVLPGVTFLDIIMRILARRGLDPRRAVLRQVLFSEPVTTGTGSGRELRVTVPPDGGQVSVSSRWLRDGAGHGPWRQNARAELAFGDPPTLPELDLSELKRGDPASADLLYARTRARQIWHGAPMTCTGTLYRSAGRLLAELRLDPSAWPDAGRFQLHPALMDAATIAAFCQNDEAADEPYIPFFIEEFRAPGPVTGTAYAYLAAPEQVSGELLLNDMTLHDGHGRVLTQFQGLACKRIRHAGLITDMAAPVTAPAVTGPAAPSPGPAGEDALVGYLRQRIGRILGQEPGAVPVGTGFYDLGLDSAALLELSAELESVVGTTLYPTLLFEYGDIGSLARHLAGAYPVRLAGAPPGLDAAPAQRDDAICLTDTWRPATPGADLAAPEHLVLIDPPDGIAESMRRAVPVTTAVTGPVFERGPAGDLPARPGRPRAHRPARGRPRRLPGVRSVHRGRPGHRIRPGAVGPGVRTGRPAPHRGGAHPGRLRGR